MTDDGARGYEAVVFDMDGTLVEYTAHGARREAAVEAFTAVGIDPTEAELRSVAEGSTANARAVCETHGVDPAAFYDRFDPALAEHQHAAVADGGKPVYGDARRALEDLAVGAELPAAVLSDNYQSVVDRVVESRFPDRFVAAHGVEPGLDGRRWRKPDTRNLRSALEAMDVPARRALVVGDGTRDVAVAARAGVDSVFLRRAGTSYDGDHEPTHRIDDLDALAAIVDGHSGSGR